MRCLRPWLVTTHSGDPGTPPCGHYDPHARSSLYEDRYVAGSCKRGPGRQIRKWSAERRARRSQDARCAFAGHSFQHRASRRSAPPRYVGGGHGKARARAPREQFMLSGDSMIHLTMIEELRYAPSQLSSSAKGESGRSSTHRTGRWARLKKCRQVRTGSPGQAGRRQRRDEDDASHVVHARAC